MSSYKRLYFNLEDNGYAKSYLTVNPDMYLAVHRNFKLYATDIKIFEFICWKYDACAEHFPVCKSYNDFAEIFKITKQGACKSIQILLENKLILKRGARKGRAKTGYVPNVEYLHKLTLEYVKDYENNKKCL